MKLKSILFIFTLAISAFSMSGAQAQARDPIVGRENWEKYCDKNPCPFINNRAPEIAHWVCADTGYQCVGVGECFYNQPDLGGNELGIWAPSGTILGPDQGVGFWLPTCNIN